MRNVELWFFAELPLLISAKYIFYHHLCKHFYWVMNENNQYYPDRFNKIKGINWLFCVTVSPDQVIYSCKSISPPWNVHNLKGILRANCLQMFRPVSQRQLLNSYCSATACGTLCGMCTAKKKLSDTQFLSFVPSFSPYLLCCSLWSEVPMRLAAVLVWTRCKKNRPQFYL